MAQVRQQAANQGGYVATYPPFDEETIPAGPMPPVRVVIEKEEQ
jgi:hypothetical protein